MSGEPTTRGSALRLEVVEGLADVPAAQWNRLQGSGAPFLRHEFLSALEAQGCLGERYGWLPRHLLVREPGGPLLGAIPLYLKFNSYGEFVFDWAWADAYERAGRHYYPKLVSASPYTPATGAKLLLAPGAPAAVASLLIQGALELARQSGASSLHWLFLPEPQARALARAGLLLRSDCQFHWQNRDYADFGAFLAALTASKRKRIRRERRRVAEAGVTLERLRGARLAGVQWDDFHALYASTFRRLGGIATLSPGFFEAIAREMPDAVLLVEARHRGRLVAAALDLVGGETLYGRHWGCHETFDGLHFEACYYQGIEFCIDQGLGRFEPGAQGEHKLSRGFLPTATWSAHWLADPRFAAIVGRHLTLEREGVADYIQEMGARSPYRHHD